MKNPILFAASIIVMVLAYLLSSSIASALLLMITLLLGAILILFFGNSHRQRSDMMTVFLASFCIMSLAAIVQYLSYDANYLRFADMDNDNYRFYITSQEGVGAPSLYHLFYECVIQNIHYENGGYYFYIKALAYLSALFADGNHLLLQQLGTAIFGILSSIVLYAILAPFCPSQKVNKYTILFIAFSPLILHSVGVHRDAIIAFFYFVLIYLWLCRAFSLKIGILQIVIAFILYYFREQHGLFALSFVVISALSSHKQKRWVYIVGIVVLVAIVGSSYLVDMMYSSYEETSQYYTTGRDEALSRLDSGIGRYIFKLPFPLRELAQIFFLQLRFPPWLGISKATSPYAFSIGILSFAVSVFWFFVFSFSILGMKKAGFKKLPRKILYGIILLFVFLFLNSSNLDSRRVVCMFPLLYVAYVYYKEYLITNNIQHKYSRNYYIVYSSICLLYLVVKITIG